MATTTSTTTACLVEWLWNLPIQIKMKRHKNLYTKLCSEENIDLAFKKARKRKTLKPYVIKFEKDKEQNLILLRQELLNETYYPKPLKTFIIREPKTRKIRKSYFVDRIVHHAICNILEPIFEKTFIYDSFANRKGKGTLNAVKRFDEFKLKASKNNSRKCYVLKADISHYFDEVDHDILLHVLKKKVCDTSLIRLINKILKNHSDNKGMPLGNMTSQFFANVYLNELDQFVKHKLKAKYYIRYVDDFVILNENKEVLEYYLSEIHKFVQDNLKIQLHPNKSKILLLKRGIPFLGYRIFYYHKLLRKSNIKNMSRQLIKNNYDSLYKYLDGWFSYADHADTFNLRKKVTQFIDCNFEGKMSLLEIDRLMKI